MTRATQGLGAEHRRSVNVDELTRAGYAERLRRVYMDLLRLEVGPSFQFAPNPVVLRRHEVLGPDGPIYVYLRRGQRRIDPATDGEFCLTAADTGQQFPANAAPTGTAHPVAQAVLDARTVVVKPWWLYADYRAAAPADRVAPDWARRFPGFTLVPGLHTEPDGKTATTEVRVCREEAQTAETGAVYASGRAGAKKGDPPPSGRLTQPPGDSAFARASRGRAVSCLSGTGFQNSVECGCGTGLERCEPGAGFANEPPAFVLPTHTPLGEDAPFESSPQPAAAWQRLWWSEEAKHFLDRIFLEDAGRLRRIAAPAEIRGLAAAGSRLWVVPRSGVALLDGRALVLTAVQTAAADHLFGLASGDLVLAARGGALRLAIVSDELPRDATRGRQS
ncbi:MAG TPA: hypothetical protein VHW23_30820 [Kofleriaceae bacterium]|nr:hypothetical protein [Kofleriaceae bacterium]